MFHYFQDKNDGFPLITRPLADWLLEGSARWVDSARSEKHAFQEQYQMDESSQKSVLRRVALLALSERREGCWHDQDAPVDT